MSDSTGSGLQGGLRAMGLGRRADAGGGTQARVVHVEGAWHIQGLLLVAGWRLSPHIAVRLVAGGTDLQAEVHTLDRGDVAASRSLPSGNGLGFGMVCLAAQARGVELAWKDAVSGNSGVIALELQVDPPLERINFPALGDAGAACLKFLPPNSPVWQMLLARASASTDVCGFARGSVDYCATSEPAGCTLLNGWFFGEPDALVWVEDARGTAVALHGARRYFRSDVQQELAADYAGAWSDTGFLVADTTTRLHGEVYLKAMFGSRIHILSKTRVKVMPDSALEIVRAALEPVSRQSEIRHCAETIAPLVSTLISRDRAQWARSTEHVIEFGPRAASPRVSLVVPLFGRTDFVELQLMAFARDPWLREHAEILYVVDDPRLEADFPRQASEHHLLHGVDFCVISGGRNRGFSGANNLGAAHARAPLLLFMNSDVFPKAPGWLEPLVQTLDTHADIGAVAPRLVYPDGSIQHAGMVFRWRPDLHVWTNDHPGMGFAVGLDPYRELTRVPAVTGACLAMRRADFDRIGGWHTGYLIGDFEDSDLCFTLREAGLHIAYEPGVELIHLERQSFQSIASGDLRLRVTLVNAVIHEHRWRAQLDASAGLQQDSQP